MPFSILDYDPVWSDMKNPIKVWATSKTSYNRYINNAKYRYNLLISLDTNLNISNLVRIQIERDLVKYFFDENVSRYAGQIQLENGVFYSYCKNYICAHCLEPKEK
jgi:hypothetical protein